MTLSRFYHDCVEAFPICMMQFFRLPDWVIVYFLTMRENKVTISILSSEKILFLIGDAISESSSLYTN
jgi:hypothetical protein